MSKISWESLYENFKSIYPRLSRSSVYFRPFGYMSILVYFEDGMRMVYDDLRKQAHITGSYHRLKKMSRANKKIFKRNNKEKIIGEDMPNE